MIFNFLLIFQFIFFSTTNETVLLWEFKDLYGILIKSPNSDQKQFPRTSKFRCSEVIESCKSILKTFIFQPETFILK